MHQVIEFISQKFTVWPEQTKPPTEYQACVFEYKSGRCWDVVHWMDEMRKQCDLRFVCCFNTNWGLSNTELHCVVHDSKVSWFNNLHEMLVFINDLSGEL